MALIDTATLVPNSGNYFIAPVGTAAPTDLSAIPATWVNIGHTSLEDIMSFESEGGEQSVLGTLQNPSLRTSYSKRSETWSIILQQWDEDSLRLYFGSNATDDGALWLHVPNTPAPIGKTADAADNTNNKYHAFRSHINPAPASAGVGNGTGSPFCLHPPSKPMENQTSPRRLPCRKNTSALN